MHDYYNGTGQIWMGFPLIKNVYALYHYMTDGKPACVSVKAVLVSTAHVLGMYFSYNLHV
jgi:hypothetical protein